MIRVDKIPAVPTDCRPSEVEECNAEALEPIPCLIAFEFAPYAGIVPIRFIMVQIVYAGPNEWQLQADKLDAALFCQLGDSNDWPLLPLGHARSAWHRVHQRIGGLTM